MNELTSNHFPVFLKLDQIQTLVIGAGAIAHEKLSVLLNQSPRSKIRLVAEQISVEVRELLQKNQHIEVCEKTFEVADLNRIQLVITAFDDIDLSNEIKKLANERGLLFHAAEQPEASDFYLERTTSRKKSQDNGMNLKKILVGIVGTLAIMISGHVFFTLIPPDSIWHSANEFLGQLDLQFVYYMIGGFIAQMIDGALGMAYGVSATTFLLSCGISPSVASMSVHTSEIFTSGVSGLMHLKFGNVHSRLFKAIVVPGVIGAIAGAYLLTEFEQYNAYIKPIVGVYTLFLGSLIIYKVVRKRQNRKKVKRAGLLAILGGFLDSVGGGGWGPVVSSTLIARGKNPRLVVGSVNLAEFFVSLASSFTFFTVMGGANWQPILGLILGGICAAPIAAHLSKKLNIKAMMLLVGIVVVIVSIRIIVMTLI